MNKTNTILNTIEISHELEIMIQSSYKYLVFVSPYLKITERLKAKLSEKFKQLDGCFFVHRKNELAKSEKDWISSFSNVHLIGVENLHSKIYLNDKQCLITSMNFYEYSQINNYEIGVKIDRKTDKNNYQRVIEEILLMSKLTPKHDILLKTIEAEIDYTAGKLFNILTKISGKYTNSKFNDEGYIEFCNDARKLVEFQNNELYQDRTAILRSANIGKARFEEIFNKLK
jgi:hypothetical protein